MAEVDRVSRFNRRKRLLDLVITVLTAPATIPIGLITAVVIRTRIGSPVLFRQARIGLDEVEFEALKFRTMTDERAKDGALLPDRVRLTPLGRSIRKLSLDEIPQLWNIVRGDMSLVGPRPLFVRYLDHYTESERARHLVRPGITGYAQVAGRNAVAWDQRLALDAEYVQRASLRLDAQIVMRTVWKVLRSDGVSVIAGDTGAPLDVERSLPRGQRVYVTPFAVADIASRVAWMRDPRTRAHMQLPEDVTIESTEVWFRAAQPDPDRHDFTIREIGTGTRIGMAGLRSTDGVSAEFYIFLDPSQTGRGFGGEASRLIFDWALESGRFNRVTLTVHAENSAALTIYHRCGFVETDRSTDRVEMALDAII